MKLKQWIHWEKKNETCIVRPTVKSEQSTAHLGTIQADDAVDIARTVVEVGDSDSMLTGRQPVLLGVGINLEDMGPCAVDGLLPKGDEEEVVNFFVP